MLLLFSGSLLLYQQGTQKIRRELVRSVENTGTYTSSVLKKEFNRLQSLQTILNNNYDIYIQTCEDVVYLRVAEDINASDYETLCLEIIDNYSYVVDEYNACLVDLLAIMENV